jgi:hypothetical protein
VFNDQQVGSTTVHQLSFAPGLQFNYAVAKGLVVLSTSLGAVSAVVSGRKALADDSLYRRAFPPHPHEVSSLLFLDFSQLLSLGEQTGLLRGATYNALRPDLKQIRTIGLASSSGEDDSNAELLLQIS